MNDISVQNEGNLFLFFGQSEQGVNWLEDNIGHAMRFGAAYVVEHRYAGPIAEGAIAEGLLVE